MHLPKDIVTFSERPLPMANNLVCRFHFQQRNEGEVQSGRLFKGQGASEDDEERIKDDIGSIATDEQQHFILEELVFILRRNL